MKENLLFFIPSKVCVLNNTPLSVKKEKKKHIKGPNREETS